MLAYAHLCTQKEAWQEQQGQVGKPESHPAWLLPGPKQQSSAYYKLIPVLPDGASPRTPAKAPAPATPGARGVPGGWRDP